MKKKYFLLSICVSLFIFVGSSVWEGAAAIGEDLPETGLFIATNSFPINTVVDVINLENGERRPLIVCSGLESSGFLALLSKDAANALGFQSQSLGRIRMIQSNDPAALSYFSDDYHLSLRATEGSPRNESAFGPTQQQMPQELPQGAPVFATIEPQVTEPVVEAEFRSVPTDLVFGMVPAESRPPERGPQPDPAHFISGTYYPTEPLFSAEPLNSDPVFTDYVRPEMVRPDPVRSYIPSPFSVPMINTLEKGKYYLQIAAYSKVESVEYEISRIDNNLPIAVMDAGTPDIPLYRVLIGPVNLGESGALLQRYRSLYTDAFVRLGP